jgi:hypothetical protein
MNSKAQAAQTTRSKPSNRQTLSVDVGAGLALGWWPSPNRFRARPCAAQWVRT